MSTMSKYIVAMAAKAGKTYSTEDESQIENYLQGKVEFSTIEPLLFKHEATPAAGLDDRDTVEAIAKEYRRGKTGAGNIARYFTLFRHIRGYYGYVAFLSRNIDIPIGETYTLFELDRSEQLDYYCTNEKYLPNPHNNTFFDPAPLGRLFDDVYEKDPETVRKIGTQKGLLIEEIYFPENPKRRPNDNCPEQYKNIPGLSYYKAAAYLYSREPSAGLKADLIADAAKQVVFIMKSIGSEAEAALLEIAGTANPAAPLLKKAFNELDNIAILPIKVKFINDKSGCRQLLDDFFTGLALSGFKIPELNDLFNILLLLDKHVEKIARGVVTIGCWLLAALDNKGDDDNVDTMQYTKELAEKTGMPKEHLFCKMVVCQSDLNEIKEILDADTNEELFSKAHPLLYGSDKARLFRIMWEQGKHLDKVKVSEDDFFVFLKNDRRNSEQLAEWIKSGGKTDISEVEEPQFGFTYWHVYIAAYLVGFSEVADVFTRYIIEKSHKNIFEKFSEGLELFGYTKDEIREYLEKCSDNIEKINALIPKLNEEEKKAQAEAEAAKAAEEAKKKADAQKAAEEDAKFIAENGYIHYDYDEIDEENIDEAESAYDDIEAELEGLKESGTTLTGLLVWFHPVYGHLQGWEVRHVESEGKTELKHSGEIFMNDGFHLYDIMNRFENPDEDEYSDEEFQEMVDSGDFEGIITGSNYYTMVDAGFECIGNALINLHKNGKFEGLIASYPFPVYVQVEGEDKEEVLTIFEEKGVKPQ